MRIFLLLIFCSFFSQLVESQDKNLNSVAHSYLKKYKVPGLAISVIKPDTIFYGLAGVKMNGKNSEIDLDSKFQIASNTKAITAAIAAKLVEEKKIKWNSNIIEIIPELKGKIKKEYYNVTLQDLLSNRGYIQPFEEDTSKEWKNIPKGISDSSNSKLQFARYAMNLEPKINPKKNHSYSNGGFIIAGLMLELCSKKSWGDLINTFNENYNTKAFIGFPNKEDSNGTYGHKKKFGKYKPIHSEEEYKLGDYFSPAGNLSISIRDISKVIKYNLNGLLGNSNVLLSETYKKIHYGLNDYSLGWYNGKIGNTEQQFSYHGGSLGTFSSAIIISADREVAIIILVNSDDKKTTELKNKIREELWIKYGKK